MLVSFIVPVRNDSRRLAGCLASIAATKSAHSKEIIVADNGSTDDSAQVAAAAGARVLTLPDYRVAELRNIAAGSASGQLLAFVDADHEIVTGWLDAAVEALSSSGVGAAGALYTPPRNGTWVQKMYGALRGKTTGISDTAWLGSGNMVVRRTAFTAVGGFDTSLEACEDVDLCRRLLAAKWRIVADERLESVHKGDPENLRALFRAERWRGRDNLRVSLRNGLTLRDLPSVVFPVAALLAIGMVVAGIAIAIVTRQMPWLVFAGVGIFAVLTLFRAARISMNLPELNLRTLLQAVTVAFTYEGARAIALVTRAAHHRKPLPAQHMRRSAQ